MPCNVTRRAVALHATNTAAAAQTPGPIALKISRILTGPRRPTNQTKSGVRRRKSLNSIDRCDRHRAPREPDHNRGAGQRGSNDGPPAEILAAALADEQPDECCRNGLHKSRDRKRPEDRDHVEPSWTQEHLDYPMSFQQKRNIVIGMQTIATFSRSRTYACRYRGPLHLAG